MPGSDLPEYDPFDLETDDFLHQSMTKERRYRHFDDPISESDRKSGFILRQFSRTHRFLPLLGFTDEKRRVFRGDDGRLRTKIKPRQIRYASHHDSAYLQAYTEYLSRKYEAKIATTPLNNCVLAYRPTGLTNIEHAKILFSEIRSRAECHVLAIDISGFFDTLDHAHLKTELAFLLNVDRLQDHDWAVFRNITRYSWVETTDLDTVLGKARSKGNRICSPLDFSRHVRGSKTGLVQTNELPFGIPQGTPISGLFANIYLLTFDKTMTEFVESMGGSYRRYSDDIAIVVPASKIDCVEIVNLTQKILSDFHLCLSEDKTDISKFYGPNLSCDQPIQYLGFIFDGKSILLRESSLNRYREKMQRGIHAKLVAAKRKGIPSDQVYQRESLSRHTHLGKRRNFLKYAYRASEILDAPHIRQQIKNHMTWFKRCWRRETKKVYGDAAAIT